MKIEIGTAPIIILKPLLSHWLFKVEYAVSLMLVACTMSCLRGRGGKLLYDIILGIVITQIVVLYIITKKAEEVSHDFCRLWVYYHVSGIIFADSAN